MSNIGILVDLDYCVGCFACQSACNDYHKLPLGETYLKLCKEKPLKVDGDLAMFISPIPYKLEACAECVAQGGIAPCQAICISKSLYIGDVEELLETSRKLGSRTALYQPRAKG